MDLREQSLRKRPYLRVSRQFGPLPSVQPGHVSARAKPLQRKHGVSAIGIVCIFPSLSSSSSSVYDPSSRSVPPSPSLSMFRCVCVFVCGCVCARACACWCVCVFSPNPTVRVRVFACSWVDANVFGRARVCVLACVCVLSLPHRISALVCVLACVCVLSLPYRGMIS